MSEYPWDSDKGYTPPAGEPKPSPDVCPLCRQRHEGPTPWCKGQEPPQ